VSTRLLQPITALTLDTEALVPISGEITLDETSVYGSADLTIPLLDVADVEDIDPREAQRAVIVSQLVGEAPRTFDLGLRSREVDHANKTIRLHCETDEALIRDYAPLADDLAPLDLRHSLRAVVNYVLNIVIPGTELEATPANDARVTMLDVDNLVDNPTVAVDTTGWGFHWNGGTGTDARVVGTAPDGDTFYRGTFSSTVGPRAGAFYLIESSVKPGTRYTASSVVRPSIAQDMRMGMEWRDEDDVTLALVAGEAVSVGAGEWAQLSILDELAPPGAARVFVTMYGENTGVDWNPGDTLDATSLRIGPTASEPLNWRAGVNGWEFLLSLTSAKQLRLFCDELRAWRLVSPDYMLPGSVVVAASSASEGSDLIDRDGDLWADGVVVRYRWNQDDGSTFEATDTAGVPGKVDLLEFDRPYPGPGAAAYRLQRLQGQGRTQTATCFTDYRATPSMEARYTLPGTEDQIGRLQAVTFDLATGMMTPSARGLTDVPETAYIFGDPGISYDDVPVGMSYEEFEWSAV
jgi:hypothetical protein